MKTRWSADGSLIDLVELCYRIESPQHEWLGALADAAVNVIGGGLGASAYVYRRSAEDRLEVDELVMSPRVDGSWVRGFLQSLPSALVSAWRHRAAGAMSSVAAFDPMFEELASFGGARDVYNFRGVDPSGHGVALSAPHPKKLRVSRVKDELFARIAAHLAAAFRIRRKLGGNGVDLSREGEAVLRPDGHVEHAEGPALERDARDALRHATLQLDRSRSTRGRSDVSASLEERTALVSARWSLLDHFDRDGRRFVVAACNEPEVPRAVELSTREAQVLSYGALGQHNKLIAYNLGLSASTVRVLLHRAAAKLGARGRRDAIEAFRRRMGAGGKSDDV